MTHDQFIQMVRHYRDNLKMYQRTKHYIYAQEIIFNEKQIDAYISDYLAKKEEEQNPKIDFSSF